MSERPILFCYDGSPESRRAIEVARDLLPTRRSVVINVGSLEGVAEAYAVAGSGAARFEHEVYSAVVACAEEGARLARDEGFPAEARAELDTDVSRSIVDVARELEACVVVLGSRSLQGVRELVEGSVSHKVAIHAHRPVLIVPA